MDSKSEVSQMNEEHVTISFKNIKYEVKLGKNKTRTILNNVSGICLPGNVTAIMGGSGAGKTSLLNILARRVENGRNVTLTGELLANGTPYDSDKFADFASYVMQQDVLFGTLTVRETLEFVANLKYEDPLEKIEKVDYALKTLKLERCQHTLIGNEMIKGISGGERKRCSIGVELVSDPKCMMLDEPTSGLDSFTAFVIINLLKKLAKTSGRTIVFTIHQPSSDIFLLFDNILLLAQGRFIYQGPRTELITYFKTLGFDCPAHSNPLDYAMEIMHQEDPNHPNYGILYQGYESQWVKKVDEQIHNVKLTTVARHTIQTSFIFQSKEVFRRAMINLRRDKLLVRGRIFMVIFFGLLIGGVFWNVESQEGYKGVQSTCGVLFFILMCSLMGALNPVLVQFPAEREVFVREENSKLYSTAAYFTGKSSIEIPFLLLFPIIQECICYWMVGLNDRSAKIVITNIFICMLLGICGNSLGLMIGSVFKDVRAATGFMPLVMLPLVIFAGFLANQNTYQVWIGWIQYLSPVKYAFEALVWNEYDSKRYEYDGSDINHTDGIDMYSFDFGKWESVGVLIGLIAFFRVMAVILLYLSRSKAQ